MKIFELIEKRNKAIESARAFLKGREVVNNTETLSDEDAATFDRMEKEINLLSAAIDREGRLANIENSVLQPTSTPIITSLSQQYQPQSAESVGETHHRATNEYKTDFGNSLRGTPLVYNVLSTSPDANGGYLVPLEFEKQIVAALEEYNIIRTIAKIITTSAERKIPIAVSHSSAQWTDENEEIAESDLKFAQKEVDAFKLTDLIKVSIELLQDSMFDLEKYIAAELARSFGVAEEEAFCIGTGVKQPAGIFTENGGEVGVTTAGATISADNLIDLVYSLKSPYRRNAVFLMKDTTVAAIRKLKDSNSQYLWQPSLQAGEPDRLLGYPLYTSPFVPAIEAGSLPVAFGDFSNFWIADRMGRTVQRLNELYARKSQVGFLGVQRVDGKVILREGIKLLQVGSGK